MKIVHTQPKIIKECGKNPQVSDLLQLVKTFRLVFCLLKSGLEKSNLGVEIFLYLYDHKGL